MTDFADARIEYYFPHPFMRHVWPDHAALNEDLRRHVLAHEAANPTLAKTNVGGWHSETGMLEFCGEAGKMLVERMAQMANRASGQVFAAFQRQSPPLAWTLRAWANVNRAGDFNRVHNHSGATWSGTYYVDAGEDGAGSPLQLFDPCQGRATTFFPTGLPQGVHVFPEPGLMVLFPSYVPHMVYPHRGERPRISIAFNLRKEPFP